MKGRTQPLPAYARTPSTNGCLVDAPPSGTVPLSGFQEDDGQEASHARLIGPVVPRDAIKRLTGSLAEVPSTSFLRFSGSVSDAWNANVRNTIHERPWEGVDKKRPEQ